MKRTTSADRPAKLLDVSKSRGLEAVPMLATMTPQAAIAQHLLRPSQCEIVVVIFWSRMGTPLPPEYLKRDRTPYLSGTEWEYLDALEAAQGGGRPEILVYRRTDAPWIRLSDADLDENRRQWDLVARFSLRKGGARVDAPGSGVVEVEGSSPL